MSDALNHASIIDGMRMSKAPRVVYPHKDTAALRELLRDARSKGRADAGGAPHRLILVVTDGVFSMDGDIAPLPEIVAAAEEFGAAVMVDDAHASGVLGRNGRGTVDHFDLHGRVHIQVGTHVQGDGRPGRLRRREPGAARDADPAGPPVPLLHFASAGRGGRVSGRDPRPAGAARADRPPLGQHDLLQGRAEAARLRHGRLGDADHAGDDGRLGDGPAASASGCSRRASSPSRWSTRRSRWTRPEFERSSRPSIRSPSSTAAWKPS